MFDDVYLRNNKEGSITGCRYVRLQAIFEHRSQVFVFVQNYAFTEIVIDSKTSCPSVVLTDTYRIVKAEKISFRVQIIPSNEFPLWSWVNIWVITGHSRFPHEIRHQILLDASKPKTNKKRK